MSQLVKALDGFSRGLKAISAPLGDLLKIFSNLQSYGIDSQYVPYISIIKMAIEGGRPDSSGRRRDWYKRGALLPCLDWATALLLEPQNTLSFWKTQSGHWEAMAVKLRQNSLQALARTRGSSLSKSEQHWS